jgi:putative SOS response-associated peptidase YedK
MCARYILTVTPADLTALFALIESVEFEPKAMVFPTDSAPVVLHSKARDGRMSTMMKWGLVPSWAKDTRIGTQMINARAETVAEKPSFRSAFTRRRCVVPASGFLEWKTEGKAKIPHVVRPVDGGVLALAGLWETWKSEAGETLRSFTVITRDPTALVGRIHDRMPALLDRELVDAWLNPANDNVETLQAILGEANHPALELFPVDRARLNAAPQDVESLVPTGPIARE